MSEVGRSDVCLSVCLLGDTHTRDNDKSAPCDGDNDELAYVRPPVRLSGRTAPFCDGATFNKAKRQTSPSEETNHFRAAEFMAPRRPYSPS